MTDPRYRQRHDHIMSSPLPLEPRTLADDPLPARPVVECPRCDGLGYNDESLDCEECDATGHIGAMPEPLAAQEPTAEPAQPEAETSDGERFERWWPTSGLAGNMYAPARTGFIAGLKRGREQITEMRTAVYRDHAAERSAHEATKAAHAAEVERLREELAVARANRDTFLRDAEHALAQLDESKAELAAARAERPMPIARALCVYHACLGWEKDGDGSCHFCSFESERHDEDCVMVDPVCDDDTCLCRALGVRREGPASDAIYTAIRDASRWRGSGYMRPARITKMTRAVLALFSPEPRGIPETSGHTDKTPDGQKAETDVTVRDSEILCLGAPAAEAAAGFETVRRAGPATSERPAAERGDGAGVTKAAGGEGLRGPGIAVMAEPKGQPEPDAILAAYAAWLDSRGSGMAFTDPNIFAAGYSAGLKRRAEQDSPVELDTSANPMTEPVPAGVLSMDGLAGMPTAWRERIERLEEELAAVGGKAEGTLEGLRRYMVENSARLDALERAVEGLKGEK